MPVATDPLWTDYLSALGAAVGVLIAGVALIIALRSAADAKRSAAEAGRTRAAAEAIETASQAALKAATEQLDLARVAHERVEADRARRPAVERIELSEIESREGELVPSGSFRVGFRNSGDRVLVAAIVTILLDPGSSPELADRWGNPTGERADDETRERWPGVEGPPRSFDYIARLVDCQIGVSYVRYVRIARRGRFAVRVKLFHAELVGGGPWIDAEVVVDDDGTTRIDYLGGGLASRPFEGRCIDFDRVGAAEG